MSLIIGNRPLAPQHPTQHCPCVNQFLLLTFALGRLWPLQQNRKFGCWRPIGVNDTAGKNCATLQNDIEPGSFLPMNTYLRRLPLKQRAD